MLGQIDWGFERADQQTRPMEGFARPGVIASGILERIASERSESRLLLLDPLCSSVNPSTGWIHPPLESPQCQAFAGFLHFLPTYYSDTFCIRGNKNVVTCYHGRAGFILHMQLQVLPW